MDERVLEAACESLPDGGFRVRSPAIGRWRNPPRPGSLVGSGARIGSLHRLTTRIELVLPQGAAGRVEWAGPLDRERQVEYGEVLFELAALGTGAGAAAATRTGSRGAKADLPAGTLAVVSPTDGTFYRRPSPEAPPFVDVGSKVRAGQAVGLVEVMKTFNRVLYGGPGFPDEAEVVEVRCGETAEVHAGQVLFVVR
jgi:acetyl-CoA carboxylase biotin carboxyl carrier protein